MIVRPVRRKPQEGAEAFVDGGQFMRRQFAKNAPDSALVYRPQVVDQGEGVLEQATLAGGEPWVKEADASGARHWNYAD